ncbi:Gfo/Idh/MocA family protein [Rhodococcus sp. NPDC056506]|uniref:Gfo/Idh/MocA family protein n=1 Tax=Rhodococcus sp. NPDC056506 TaxID=3345844 RepID=UPI0036729970
MTPTPLRIGILGASRIAENAMIKPATATGHRLVAVAARNPERARAYAAQHGIERVVGSYAELISDPEVDVVYNALPNSLHGPWNLAAIQADKHVLTEKPFSSNAAEAQAVVEAARVSGVTLLEGFHYLFHPVNRRLLDLVRNGAVGELTRVETVLRMPTPAENDPRWELALAGGSLMDLGCYGLHASRMLSDVCGGAPVVTATRHEEYVPGVDSWFDIELEYPSGATASVVTTMLDERYHFTFRVFGTEGDVLVHNFLQPDVDDRVSVTAGGHTIVEHLGTTSSYTYQLEALADHLAGDSTLPIGPADALANMTMIDAAYTHSGLGVRPTTTL